MYDPTETEGASEEPSCPLTTEKEEESSEECTDNSCSSGQCGQMLTAKDGFLL